MGEMRPTLMPSISIIDVSMDALTAPNSPWPRSRRPSVEGEGRECEGELLATAILVGAHEKRRPALAATRPRVG